MKEEKRELSLEEKIRAFPTTVYSRVVWWLAPTSSFNKGKIEEYKNRKMFKLKK
jgi:hypothetical protein